MTDDNLVAKTLVTVVTELIHSVEGLVLEVKGMRKHGDSAGYFLQITCEDLLKTAQELKEAIK